MRLLSRFTMLLFGALLAGPPAVVAREIAVPSSDLLPAELVGIRALPDAGMALLLLRTADGRSELPMFTGMAEAEAIDRAWRGIRPERPQTHELLGDMLQATGWKVERLVIDELRDGQFLAALELRGEGGKRRLLDTRPSDGLALVLRTGAPVQVARQVIRAAERDENGSKMPRPMIAAVR